MGNPISAHGTLVARAPAATPTVFTTIGHLGGDITSPDLTRKEIDVSEHNRDIDVYVLGMLRRGALMFPINYVADDPTHDNLTGVYAAMRTNEISGWRLTYPDGDVIIMSGQVAAIKKKAPVDDKLAADITVRMTGAFLLNGMVIGG